MINFLTKHKHRKQSIIIGLLLLVLCSVNFVIVEHAIDSDHSTVCELCSLGTSLIPSQEASSTIRVPFQGILIAKVLPSFFDSIVKYSASRGPPSLLN